MASTNFDILHLRFARTVGDPVASASTAGLRFTVANRSDYLNRAIKILQRNIVKEGGLESARQMLQALEGVESITFASGGTAVPTDYNEFPYALSDGNNIYGFHPRKEDLIAKTFTTKKYAFTVSEGKIFAYKNGSQVTSGTGTFYYMQLDEGVQGTTDILLPKLFWDEVVAIAYGLSKADSHKE